MSIRLTCLGGAAAWPNPGQGCSSFLATGGATSVLLDCGPNTLLELRKHIAWSTLDAVVISHCHSDHILDLVPFRYGLKYGVEQPETPIPIWLPPGGVAVLNNLASALGGKGEDVDGFWDEVFDLREYDPLAGLDVGAASISFARTEHAAECYAMRLEAPGGATLAYTADTGSIGPVLDISHRADILIAEATMPEEQRDESGAGHLTPSLAGDLARIAGARSLVLTHLWFERPDGPVVREAATAYHGPIHVAKPGVVLDV